MPRSRKSTTRRTRPAAPAASGTDAHPQDRPADDVPAELWTALVRSAWPPALRFALDADGAATRCGRRACRLSGECHLTWQEGRPLSCSGLSDEILIRAAGHALFACMMARRFAGDIVFSPPAKLEGDAGPRRLQR